MEFNSFINNVEKIKEDYKGDYDKQKELLKEQMIMLSKLLVDDNNIVIDFSSPVSELLAKSDFSLFYEVPAKYPEREKKYYSDASIGIGDLFNIRHNSKQLLNQIYFATSDQVNTFIIKLSSNKVIVAKIKKLPDNSSYKTINEYELKNGEYHHNRIIERIIKKEDGIESSYSKIFSYDIDSDELTEDIIIETFDKNLEGKKLSSTSISSVVEKSDYIIKDRLISFVNNVSVNNNGNNFKKVRKLENSILKSVYNISD